LQIGLILIVVRSNYRQPLLFATDQPLCSSLQIGQRQRIELGDNLFDRRYRLVTQQTDGVARGN